MSDSLFVAEELPISTAGGSIGCVEPTLDGIVLLRYAHMYRNRTSGGVERYLRQINEGLLEKHRMTILQMHLVPWGSIRTDARVEIEKHGKGQVVWLPVGFQQEDRSLRSLPRRLKTISESGKALAATGAQAVSSTIQRALNNSCGHLRYSTMIFSEGLVDVLEEYRVRLVLFHWLSYDVQTLAARMAFHDIPYAIVHHFDNGRLNEGVARQVTKKSVAVGGVSKRNVPKDLQHKYFNLSDAVDLNFFAPHLAKVHSRPDGFVVLLPSRIASGKGHRDLLLAVRSLGLGGKCISIVFAGASDSDPLMSELKREAMVLGLSDRVLYAGELTPEELRDWYAMCDVVVLPTHSEGLGRVLLEGQAMGKPVIAYESGGTPEALVHEETGFIVEKGSHAGLAERIMYLVHHPAERIAMGEAGRRFVTRQYSMPTLIERHQYFMVQALIGNRSSVSLPGKGTGCVTVGW